MKNPIIKKISNFKDNRGFYWSTWKKNDFKEIIFNHDKFSISKKNVLRGFHCDFKSFKMLTCVYGKILLVIFDANKIKDNSTWDNPHQYPSGIDLVMVNGNISLEKGAASKGLHGKVLSHAN